MVLLKPALANLLLPHILADLARADADGRLARALSRPVRPTARGRWVPAQPVVHSAA